MLINSVFEYGLEDLQHLMDQVKDLIIFDLMNDKIISEEVAKEYSTTHTLIAKKPSKISCFINKMMKKDNEGKLVLFVAKIRKGILEEKISQMDS